MAIVCIMNKNMRQEIIKGETYLGIEFGSTRIKATFININFETISTSYYVWENKLMDGYWTYNLDETILGLQKVYGDIKQYVEDTYDLTLNKIGAIGCSAMMQGYIALDNSGELLIPFRTWRNTTTAKASSILTEHFNYKIPQRWSISHLYQAILNDEEHIADIDYITTLSGYIHWQLTGEKILGIGDASGMFPIDENQFNETMLTQFSALISDKEYTWNIKDILPKVLSAGKQAGALTKHGALLIDPTGDLQTGIPCCPPEGDAGTGMVATNSVKKNTGNISVGTSIFGMIVLEKDLFKVYPQIDIVTTPDGSPVAMVLANNCSSDLNAWINLFGEFYEAMGQKPDRNELFNILFNKVLEADSDGGGLLSYGYYSGENITGFEEGRPIFIRSPKSTFNLANFMRTHLFTAFAALRIGFDILTKKELVQINSIMAHGGLFKTPLVGQKICAAALNIPVSVMSTASEGGSWGIAILASYMLNKKPNESLPDYLSDKVFSNSKGQKVYPDSEDVNGFNIFLERYKNGLTIEQAAIDCLIE